jgi:hypothetical protein
MQSLTPEIVKQPLTVDQFHKKVTTLLKKYLPIRVRKAFSPKVEQGFVYVGGCYHSAYDEDYEKCIEVLFQYKAGEKIINLTLAGIFFLNLSTVLKGKRSFYSQKE